eukprot:jgi/Astpho2/7597/Aster-02502
MSTSEEGLQRLLNALQIFCENRRLRVSLVKTEVVVFETQRQECSTFTYSGHPLTRSDSFKYLGITVETCSLPMQVKVVRYLVGGPSVLTAEDLARHDDEIARKTDVVMLSSEQVQKAHRNLVNVLRNAGCSKVLEIVRVSLGAGISMENLLVYMGVQRNAV